MFKKKIFVFPVIIVVIIVGLLCVNMRYYSSEIEAYNAMNSDVNVITEKISSVRYDDVEVFLGVTSENKYIVTPFLVKKDKYKSKSNFYICDKMDFDTTGNDSSIINLKRYYYNIVREELYEEEENVEIEKFSYNGINYVFRICQRDINDTSFEFKMKNDSDNNVTQRDDFE